MKKRLASFVVEHRRPIFVIMAVIVAVCAFLTKKVVTNEDLTKYLPDKSPMKQGIDIMLNTKATEILLNDDGCAVGVVAEDADHIYTINAKAVILATGASPKTLGIEGEKEFTGHGVSYCATCDGAFYKDKVVAVNGGGNTAVEDAIYLAGIAAKVYLIHRRNEFRADEVLVNAAKEISNLEIVTPYVVDTLTGEPKLSGLELTNKEDGSKKTIEVDGLFVAIGQEPKTADFKDLVTLTGGYIEAGENCKTNVEGIFVAGDCRTKKVRQLTTACADGAVAALAAIDYIKLGV